MERPTLANHTDLDINRPTASSATTSSSKAIRVHIDSGGDVFIDGQPVRTWVIQNYVRDKLDLSSESTVLVVADEGVPAGKLIEVVDQCRMAGAANVGVVTEQEGG